MHVLVVGSGLIGTATAWFLRQQGATVTVVDRADGAAMETSYANAGMLTPSMADPWNAPGVVWKLLRWLGREDAPLLLRPRALPGLAGWGARFLWHSGPRRFEKNMWRNLALASYSLDELRALRAELGLQYCQRLEGTLKIFRDQHSFELACTTAAKLGGRGVEHRVLDRDGLVAVEPSLASVAGELVGGIHHPDDESGDAHLFSQALATAAAGAGVEFRFGTAVTGFTRHGARLAGALTASGEISADAFVIAAGSYSPLLLKGLGIRLPVRPVKGYSITLPCRDPAAAPLRPVTDDTLHIAVTPFGDRIRVAGTAEFAGLDRGVSDSRIRNLTVTLRALFPALGAALDAATDVHPWSGLRPMSADGVPILGPTAIDNLFLNTGHGHLGWTMATGSGRAVAELIVNGAASFPIAGYQLDRF